MTLALSSTGIARPHRSYYPVRLPPGPTCLPRRWRRDLRQERASPDYPDHRPNVPCPCAEPARRFKDFTYRTLDSWSRSRRVVGKAEHLAKGANT